MERYTQIIDDTVNKFKRLFPDCYDFIQKDIDRIGNETFKAIERYQIDVAVKGVEKVNQDLDRHLNAATEIFDMGQDFLQSHNGRNYKSAASNILIGMLEIAWIKEFKTSHSHQSGAMDKDIGGLTAPEIGLRCYYLNKHKIERFQNGADAGRKYKSYKDETNIKKAYNAFANKKKEPTKAQLQNVMQSLGDYPDIQTDIQNDLNKNRGNTPG